MHASGSSEPIMLACPSCRAHLKLTLPVAGRRIRCPNCEFVFTLAGIRTKLLRQHTTLAGIKRAALIGAAIILVPLVVLGGSKAVSRAIKKRPAAPRLVSGGVAKVGYGATLYALKSEVSRDGELELAGDTVGLHALRTGLTALPIRDGVALVISVTGDAAEVRMRGGNLDGKDGWVSSKDLTPIEQPR